MGTTDRSENDGHYQYLFGGRGIEYVGRSSTELTMRISLRSLVIIIAFVAFGIVASMRLIDSAKTNEIQSPIRTSMHRAWEGLRLSEGRWPTWQLSDIWENEAVPLNSWRYHSGHNLHPYLASADFDAKWSDSRNALNAAHPFYSFCLPRQKHELETVVLAITGEGAAFDQENPHRLSELDSNVIILAEATKSGVHWMQPGDYDVKKLLSFRGTLGQCIPGASADRVNVAFADGQIWCLRADTPVEVIKPFLTVKSLTTRSREDQLSKFRIGPVYYVDRRKMRE